MTEEEIREFYEPSKSGEPFKPFTYARTTDKRKVTGIALEYIPLKGIDLSEFPNLEVLIVDTFTIPLNLSKNPKLKYLSCVGCKIRSLDLSKNIELEFLDCSYNDITRLDLEPNVNLRTLNTLYNDNIEVYTKQPMETNKCSLVEAMLKIKLDLFTAYRKSVQWIH